MRSSNASIVERHFRIKKNWINILRRRIQDGKNPARITEAGINLSSLDAYREWNLFIE
jgi:hypothetical protein